MLKIVWQTNHPSDWRGMEGDIYNLCSWARKKEFITPYLWVVEQKLRKKICILLFSIYLEKSIFRKFKSVRFMNFHWFPMETVGRRSRRKSLAWLVPWTGNALVPWTGNAMWCTKNCFIISVSDKPFAFSCFGGRQFGGNDLAA